MTLLLAFVLSIDALSISIAYKLKSISFPIISKLIICSIIFVSSITAILFGNFFSSFITGIAANITGSLLLILSGIFIIKSSITETENCDVDNSKNLEPKEAIYLGIILSFEAFSTGIGLGFINFPPVIYSALTAFFHFLFLCAGEYMAEILLNSNLIKEKTSEIIAGLILIIIAILKLF